LVDLDGDGYPDLISGSWPGEIFFFRGGPDHTFAPPVKLKYKNGKTINVGGGRRDSGDMILVAGDATFESAADGGSIIVYEGERIPIPKGKSGGITGTASAVHAFDWNGNGVLDLIVGDVSGNVWLVPNEGTKKEYAFGKEIHLQASGQDIRVAGDAGPFVADWDGDGKPDLIVGAGDGSVTFFRNIGTRTQPVLAAGETLVPPGTTEFGPGASKDARRGIRSKVCVVDWNGDGRLDLLVGDFATQKPDLPEPTAEQKAEHDKLRKEQEAVMNKYRELSTKTFGPNRVKDEAELKKLQSEMQEVMQKMTDIRKKLPADYENHGWVWLFLRKPAEARAGAR
jgi:VCBS repeat protein